MDRQNIYGRSGAPLRRPVFSSGLTTLAVSLLLAFAGTPGAARAQEAPVAIRIAAQPLGGALLQLADQAGLELAYAPGTVQDVQAPAVSGDLTPDQALRSLLAGTGIEFRRAGKRVSLSRPVADTAQLEPVVVQGAYDNLTEGSHSYAYSGPSATSTKLGISAKETPQTISVMTQQRIEDQGLTSIQEVLQQTPGLTLVALGSEKYQVLSRGYPINNYQLDGVNTYTKVYGLNSTPSQTLADMAIYDHVEVLRGASGLVTGAGNPSGTINMIRKKPTREFLASVELSGGTWDTYRGAVDVSGPLNDAASVRGRFVSAYQDGDSFIDGYGKKRQIVYGVLEADVTDDLRVTAGVDYQHYKSKGAFGYTGVPMFFSNGQQTDFPRSFSAAGRNADNSGDATNAFVTLEQSLGNEWKAKLSTSYVRESQVENLLFLGSDTGFADQVTGEGISLAATRRDHHATTKGLDLNVQGPFSLFGRRHELVLGFEYLSYRDLFDGSFDTTGLDGKPVNIYTWNRSGSPKYGEKYVDQDRFMHQRSVYAAGRFELADGLKAIIGARRFDYDYDYAVRTTDNLWNTHSPESERGVITPYAGLIYDVTRQHSVYASYTNIYQPDSSLDRNGALLDPVEGANYEVGLKSTWLDGALTSALAVYQIRQDNLPEPDPGYLVPGTDSAAYRSVKGARTNGFDIELNGELTPGWNIAAAYSFNRTKDANGKRISTTSPMHLAKLWTTYRLPGDWHRLTVGGGVNWQSGIHMTVAPWQIGHDVTAKQKAYAVTNLMARYQFNKQLSGTLNVNNVFDKQYIASLDSNFYSGMYGAPRNVMLNMRYAF